MGFRKLILLGFLGLAPIHTYALRESRPIATDNRIRVMIYNPDDVFKFTGYYKYQTSIDLSPSEEVITVSMGDTTAWQIVPSGNKIFLKPIEPNATTNMTLITNKRTYFFQLHAEEASDIEDPNLVFNLRFLYPDEENTDNTIGLNKKNEHEIDLTHPEKYNFQYSISGPDDIAPVKIFDDGAFTYVQFRDQNAEIPSFFAVDDKLRESMLNYRLSEANKNLVIIEHVFAKMSFRLGKKILCVYNDYLRPVYSGPAK